MASRTAFAAPQSCAAHAGSPCTTTTLAKPCKIIADGATIWAGALGCLGDEHRRIVRERGIAVWRHPVALAKAFDEAPRVSAAIFRGERGTDVHTVGERRVRREHTPAIATDQIGTERLATRLAQESESAGARTSNENHVGVLLLEVGNERLEILLLTFADRISAHDQALEATHKSVSEAATIRIVLVEDRGAPAAASHREAGDLESVHRVTGDDAEGPR